MLPEESLKYVSQKRVAIVHDWLVGMRGGEKVLEIICELYPNAEIFTGFYEENEISDLIKRHPIHTSSFGKIPGVNSFYRQLLPFFPLVSKDLSRKISKAHSKKPFDFVLSISHCFAKNVDVPESVKHYCYCLTPMRYIWDHFDTYFSKSKLTVIYKFVAWYLRLWDKSKCRGVNRFSGISRYICDRILRNYERASEVVYPPVEVGKRFDGERLKRSGFLVVNALVPYKNTHLIVDAFNQLGHELKIVGTGPELAVLKENSKPNIKFLGRLSEQELVAQYRSSRALVFAAEEDFGITPVEMLAAGGPVIAPGIGGAKETVFGDSGKKTGVLITELSAINIAEAVEEFIRQEGGFSEEVCKLRAEEFATERFVESLVEDLSKLGLSEAREEFLNAQKTRTAV